MCVNTFIISTLITGISVFCYFIINDKDSENSDNNDDNKNQIDKGNQTIINENEMIPPLRPPRKLRKKQNQIKSSNTSQDYLKICVKPRDTKRLFVITKFQDVTSSDTLFLSEQNIIASTYVNQPNGLTATSSQSNNVQYDKSKSSIERHDKTQYKHIPSTFICPHRLRQKSQTKINKTSLFKKLSRLFKNCKWFGNTLN